MKIVGFAGFSGAGKTTRVERVNPVFWPRGPRESVDRHAHHRFGMESPGQVGDRLRIEAWRAAADPCVRSAKGDFGGAAAILWPERPLEPTGLTVPDLHDTDAATPWLIDNRIRFDYSADLSR